MTPLGRFRNLWRLRGGRNHDTDCQSSCQRGKRCPRSDNIRLHRLFCGLDDFCNPRPSDTEGSWAHRDTVWPACRNADPDRFPVASRARNMGRPVWRPDRQPPGHAPRSARHLAPDLRRNLSAVPSGGARDRYRGRIFLCVDHLCVKVLPAGKAGLCTWHRRGGKCRRRCDQVRRASGDGGHRMERGRQRLGARARCRCDRFLLLHQG